MYNNLVLNLKELISYGELKNIFKDIDVDLVPMNAKYSKETICINGLKAKKEISTFDSIMMFFQKPINIESLKKLFRQRAGIEIEIHDEVLKQA